MTRFLSREWVDAFNAALQGVQLADPGEDAGLAVRDGPVTVAEEIRGGPEGDVRLLLRIDQGTLRLARGAQADSVAASSTEGEDGAPDVTMVLSYEDAAAMSAGRLSPADALNEGRIRVRGDLTVLVAAQQMLAEAGRHVAGVTASTTY
jgi:putative sterol carrier protein